MSATVLATDALYAWVGVLLCGLGLFGFIIHRHLLRRLLFVVFVCRQQARRRTDVLEQRRAVARVLGGDPGHAAQNFDSALREVAKITQRRWHYI